MAATKWDIYGHWDFDPNTTIMGGNFFEGMNTGANRMSLWKNPGSGGGSNYTVTGNAAGSMFSYLMGGGNINDITFNNGYALWGTVDDADSYKYTDTDQMLTGFTGGVTLHKAKVDNNTFWDDVTKKLGVFGFANDVKLQLIESGVRSYSGLTIIFVILKGFKPGLLSILLLFIPQMVLYKKQMKNKIDAQ